MNRLAFLMLSALSACIVETRDLCPEDWPEGDRKIDQACRERFCREEPEKYPQCMTGSQDAGDDAALDSDAEVEGAQGDGGPALCLENEECPAEAPRCAGGSCTACRTDGDCTSRLDTPACDADSGKCVQCTQVHPDLCSVEDAVCKAETNTCVECASDPDCGEEAPHCGADNRCSACEDHEDCERFGKVCSSGVCVQCTPATEQQQCSDLNPGDNIASPACDPVANTCTGKPRGSVGECGGCSSDSECAGGDHRCVPVTFQGTTVGAYCLPFAPTMCSAPLSERGSGTSVLGLRGDYCFPDAERATCEAILDRSKGCENESECGATGIADALCIGAEAKKCTYRCNSDDDCEGVTCIGSLGSRYCSPN